MLRVVISSPKGGCGKTTIARNLAAAAACDGLSVSTADLDLQRTLSRWARRRPAGLPGVNHYEANLADVDALMAEEGVELTDLLIIDTPPSIEMQPAQAKRLMTGANLVLVPCRATYDDVELAVPYLQVLRDMGARVAVVMNAVKPRVNAAAEKTLLLRVAEVCPIEIGDRADYNRAAAKGLSLVDINGHVGGDEFRGLWAYVQGRMAPTASVPVPAKRGSKRRVPA